MTSRTNGVPKTQSSRSYQGERPHWVLIAGGALLSSLSIRLGYKLKQALDSRQQNQGRNSIDNGRLGNCRLRSNDYSFTHDEDTHFSYDSGNGGIVGRKHTPNGHGITEPERDLQLATVPAPEYAKQNGVLMSSASEK